MTVRRVGITGMGVVSAYGRGLETLWRGLQSGQSAIRRHRARLGRRAWLEYPMAELRDDPAEIARSLPKPQVVEQAHLAEDPDLTAIADSVGQALADSKLSYDPAGNDVGIIVTHESPGLAPHVQSFFRWGRTAKAWLRSRSRFNPAEFLYEQQHESVYRLHSFLYIHHLSALFDLHGFSLYNNNACASGAFAMALAADRIRSGEASALVVAGGDLPEDGTKFRWFHDLGLYSATGKCRPFAAGRDGMVLGSGAAALVLEDLDRASADGRRVYAEWLGSGFTSEGWKVTMPDVTSGRYAHAIAAAMRSAGVRPDDISLITPHGVGSGLYDHFEALSLASVFGGNKGDNRPAWPPLMVLKGAVGHTLGGCALVETVASILALEAGEIPTAGRCVDTDPALPLGRPREGPLPARWTFLKCTNGFAGQNGAIVLRSASA